MTIQQLLLGGGALDGKKYVDDYFSTLFYVGDGQPNRVIETGIDLSSDGGLVIIKICDNDRSGLGSGFSWGDGRGLGLTDSISGASGAWWAMSGTYYSSSNSSKGLVSNFGNGTVTVSDFTPAFNGTDHNNKAVSQGNWSHVNYLSNGNKPYLGYNPMKYLMYVHRQLPGYFKIFQYTGTGGSRSITHNLEAEVGICWAFDTGGHDSSFWSYGTTSPNYTGGSGGFGPDGYKQNAPVFSSNPSSTTLNLNSAYNYSGHTYTLYLWARPTSNSKIFGDDENECFTFANSVKGSNWAYDSRPRFPNMFGQPGGIPGKIIMWENRSSYSANNIPQHSDYMVGSPMGWNDAVSISKYNQGGLAMWIRGNGGGGYVNFKMTKRNYFYWLGGTDGGQDDVAGHGVYMGDNPSDGASYKKCMMAWRYANMKPPEHGSDLFNASWTNNNQSTRRIDPFAQGNARADWVICSADGSNGDKFLQCRAHAWTQRYSHNRLKFTTDSFVKSNNYILNPESFRCWHKGWLGTGYNSGSTQPGSYYRFTYAFRDRLKAFHHWDLWYENSGTHPHSFQAAPKMMLIKKVRSENDNNSSDYNTQWWVYHAGLNQGSSPQNYAIKLNSDAAKVSGSSYWGNTAPTATQFTVGSQSDLFCSDDEDKMLVTMWNDVDGIQKIGSYTGNGSFVNVNCGFSDGSRFILIKREDGSGDWYVFDHAHGLGGGQYIDEAVFRDTGTHSWTCPSGVTSVCAVCVGGGGGPAWKGSGVNSYSGGGGGGLGWKNNISVTPGQSYTVVVGKHGNNSNAGEDSYFINTSTVKGGGGQRSSSGGAGGTYTGDGGGNGGAGATAVANGTYYNKEGGAGGAGGYSGNGGPGLNDSTVGWPYYANANGSGGGGSGSLLRGGESGGGGVGLYGEGENGEITWQNGSGASDEWVQGKCGGGSMPPGFASTFDSASQPSNGLKQYAYGGGMNTDYSGSTGGRNQGFNGGVRLVWSTNASETVAFPSTNVGCARPPYQKLNNSTFATVYDGKHVCSLPTGFGVHDSSLVNINGAKYIYLAVSGADGPWKKR